ILFKFASLARGTHCRIEASGLQGVAGDLNIIEGNFSGASGLSFFVSFAGDQHNVTGLGLTDCELDGATAISLDLILSAAALESWKHLRDDFHRIFAAGIVRGDDYIVAALSRSRGHEWTLALVAIAATSEEGDDP